MTIYVQFPPSMVMFNVVYEKSHQDTMKERVGIMCKPHDISGVRGVMLGNCWTV